MSVGSPRSPSGGGDTFLQTVSGSITTKDRRFLAALQQEFTACSVQSDWAHMRLMGDDHLHHLVDPLFRTFDERGVSVATRKADTLVLVP